jgi:signal recognition particle subunit SRP72
VHEKQLFAVTRRKFHCTKYFSLTLYNHRELIDVPFAFRGTSNERKQKGNKESTLRRRAKKREAYLEKLQRDGKYNPDRPLRPDPERWIPKSQRSYNKRGRKGRSKFVGAQGGGTGFGAEKEAARLDVAARVAARKEGKESFSQFSTAHLSAASSQTDRGGQKR